VSGAARFLAAVLGSWCVVFVIGASPAGAAPFGTALRVGSWIRPVDGAVVRGFDPPDSPFGPGHLGVDFAVAPGTPVRAAGDGVVVFAGRVGAALHVVTRHPGDVRTSDSFLASISVVAGQAVSRGAVLGTSGGTGPGHAAGVLHFAVRVGAVYVDPMLLFAPPDLGAVVHLTQPHHGASAAPADSGPDTERKALAAEIRADGETATAPPSWWDDPPPAGPVARGELPVTAGVALATSPSESRPVVAPAVVGSAFVAASVGGLAIRRRRRRGPG
jgi:hypothetical protein